VPRGVFFRLGEESLWRTVGPGRPRVGGLTTFDRDRRRRRSVGLAGSTASWLGARCAEPAVVTLKWSLDRSARLWFEGRARKARRTHIGAPLPRHASTLNPSSGQTLNARRRGGEFRRFGVGQDRQRPRRRMVCCCFDAGPYAGACEGPQLRAQRDVRFVANFSCSLLSAMDVPRPARHTSTGVAGARPTGVVAG